jgi:hypothetical protein
VRAPMRQRSSMSVTDEFAFSIPNFPAFKAENFAKCVASSDRTKTDSRRDDVQVCFVPLLLQNSFWITEHKFSAPLLRRSNVCAT